ncbi:hypothetical protein AAMO2058_001186700 [Amorphochlora amoebiformis]
MGSRTNALVMVVCFVALGVLFGGRTSKLGVGVKAMAGRTAVSEFGLRMGRPVMTTQSFGQRFRGGNGGVGELQRSRGVGEPQRSVKVQSSASEAIKNDVATNTVMIYSKSYCPFCVKVKELFSSELKVDAKVIELDEQPNSELEDTLKQLTQQRTVPQVFVQGKFIGGCDDTVAAARAGKLQELLASGEA